MNNRMRNIGTGSAGMATSVLGWNGDKGISIRSWRDLDEQYGWPSWTVHTDFIIANSAHQLQNIPNGAARNSRGFIFCQNFCNVRADSIRSFSLPVSLIPRPPVSQHPSSSRSLQSHYEQVSRSLFMPSIVNLKFKVCPYDSSFSTHCNSHRVTNPLSHSQI